MDVGLVLRGQRLTLSKAMPRRREEGSHEGQSSGVQTRYGQDEEHDLMMAAGSEPRWQCCERECPNVLDTLKLCTRADTDETEGSDWDVDEGGMSEETSDPIRSR